MASNTEIVYNVHWDIPFNYDSNDKISSDDYNVLYAIYGAHPLYGSNVLLYIGKTDRGCIRIKEHEWWLNLEPDVCTIRLASVGIFESWGRWKSTTEPYSKPEGGKIVNAIESLLILAHQPAYNEKCKKTAPNAKNVRIFNTGYFGSLSREVSGLYWCDTVEEK